MASAPIESMIVEDKSEPEKPVDREKVSIILLCFSDSKMKDNRAVTAYGMWSLHHLCGSVTAARFFHNEIFLYQSNGETERNGVWVPEDGGSC